MCIILYRNIDSDPPDLQVNLLKQLGCCARYRSVCSSCLIEPVGVPVGKGMQQIDKNQNSWDEQLEESKSPGVYEEAKLLDTLQKTDYETPESRNPSC